MAIACVKWATQKLQSHGTHRVVTEITSHSKRVALMPANYIALSEALVGSQKILDKIGVVLGLRIVQEEIH